MTLQQLIFYLASAILLTAASMVVMTRHPVRGIIFLVLAFISSAVLWLLLEAEFLALALIFVYVGAVMTLFLFVVMMLNIEKLLTRKGKIGFFAFGFLTSMGLVYLVLNRIMHGQFSRLNYPAPQPRPLNYSNTKALGAVLYTHYVLAFELAAVILLVAIIAAIGITFRGTRQGTRSQNAMSQIAVNAKDRLRLIKMKPEKP